MSTSLESLAFRVEVECAACWGTIGVPSIVTPVTCACGATVALDAAFWRKVIGSGTIASILEAKDDALQTMRYTSGRVTRFGWGRRPPRCEQCEAMVALDQLAAGMTCSCGASLGVALADELPRAIDARVRFVVAPAPSTSRLFYVICAYGDADRREAQWVHRDVRRKDAETDTLTEDQFRRLAADADDGVREAIARNRDAPPAILGTLVADKVEAVRANLAKNPSTPLETLTRLATDKERDVRQIIAWSSRATVELLTILAGDKERDIREIVAKGSRTPPEVLMTLATDKESDVREFVAKNPLATREILAKLARDPDEDVRRWVVDHPNATAEMLVVLARDSHFRIRAKVAKDPRTPAEALAILAKDTDSDVEKALRENPVLTPELIEELKRG